MVATLAAAPVSAARPPERWLGGWATPQQPQQIGGVQDQTLRHIVRTYAGGSALRIVLSNAEGSGPVEFGHVTIGVRDDVKGVRLGSMRDVSFGGRRSLRLAAGEEARSDVVNLAVPAMTDLAVSLHVRHAEGPFVSGHGVGRKVSWMSSAGSGDWSADQFGIGFTMSTAQMFWVSTVEVLGSPRPVVVALGDSITDGHYVLPELDQDWPAVLANRLGGGVSVINAGIGGNALTRKACSYCGRAASIRLERDVLDIPGVTHVILLTGTNDVAMNVPATTITAAMADIARRAHARGIKVIAGTLLPRDDTQVSWVRERHIPVRHAVNDWIRASNEFDGVIDFDEVMRDPANHEALNPNYDSGDRLHPNPNGFLAMGSSVDTDLITR